MKPIFESISGMPYSVSAYFYSKDSFEAPWHFHPQFEMVYILAGKGTRYVGNSIELFEEGDLVIIAGNVPHCWKNSSDYIGDCQSVVVQWMGEALTILPEYEVLSALITRARQGVRFLSSVANKYEGLVRDIVLDDPFLRYVNFLNLLGKLKEETNFYLLCDTDQDYRLDTTTSERLNQVYQYIENNFSTRIRLGDIASEINMSGESFSRFFSKSMKKPFFSFLNEYRINKACKLLIETSLPISNVCYSCGFDSLPFFHKQFKKFKKKTPLQFRNEFLMIGH